jgi:BirA family biotin operon repressor/biotin-[acetyl-CoA-carboxylase] ligase
MCRRIETWDRGSGFSAILGDWIAAARGIGEAITVRNGTSEKHGRFAGLDRSGRLVLELHGGGTDLISAGDVFPFDIAGDRVVRGRN